MKPVVPELVLSYAPPAPLPGGGAGRRLRRPLWGIAPLAADPDLWPEGPRRRRLVRAATVTSAMGIVWVGTPTGGQLPVPTPDGPVTAQVPEEDGGHADRPSSPVAFDRSGGGGDGEAGRGPSPAGAHPPAAAPLPAERAPLAESGQRAEAAAAPRDAEAWRDNVIATFGDVELVQPSPHVAMVGFHEGGGQTQDLSPGARPDRDLGRQRVESDDRRDPLASMVLPTRERGTGSATALDVAMPVGRTVHSPVSGTVRAVNPYTLYGKYADTIITIELDGAPGMELKVLHVTGPRVAIGDRVRAGQTVLADSPTALPFSSQIDRFVEEREGRALPHVHLEVVPVGG